jgi:PAS domain S-box-containing protein
MSEAQRAKGPKSPADRSASDDATPASSPAAGSDDVLPGEAWFRLLVQSVKDYAIFVLDPQGHVASWNAGAERIKGYNASDILGRHFSNFYLPDDLAADRPGMELRVAAREGRFEDEGWRVRKDGTLFWANVVITALRNEQGELVGFAKVTRDLTERRAAEAQAVEDARRLAEAETANRTKSEFLAALSHELRTPLNAIGGYLDLLTLGVHGPLNEEQRRALDRIRASQRHLVGLITDLLDFGRLEAGRVRYDIGEVHLADVADAVRPLVEPLAAARDISLEWQETDESVVALADRPRSEQILLNLVTNAIKYTQFGGHVIVRHFLRDDRAALEVDDDGIGIPESQMEAIFEPFTQLGRSLTSAHEGTGLGLAISRDLARGMGGDLTVRSVAGDGSTFTLSLPRPAES